MPESQIRLLTKAQEDILRSEHNHKIAMKKYYEVHVEQTSKAIGSKETAGRGYRCFHRQTEKFGTLDEVKTFLKRTYGKSKREKMYQDTKDGEAIHIGYIYKFKSHDYCYDSRPWYQQDWVEVREIKSTTIIV